MGIQDCTLFGHRRNARRMFLAAGAFMLAVLPASAATFGPGSQLVGTFTLRPNPADLIFFLDEDVPVITGSPVFTTSIYDGQTLLGTSTSKFVNGGPPTFVNTFGASSSIYKPVTVIPFSAFNTGTFNGRIITTVTGGSVTNFNPASVVFYDAKSVSTNTFTQFGDLTVNSLTLNGPVTSSLPHFVFGGGFVMAFYALNNNDQPAAFTINFYDDAGKAATLPFSSRGPSTTLTDTLPPRGANYYEAGTFTTALVEGSGMLAVTPGVTVQALMRRQGSDGSFYEAAVEPAAGYTEFLLPFDATIFSTNGSQIYTGFAIANLDPSNAAAVNCTARNSNGDVVSSAVPVPALSPLGHWANYLFPLLTGLRGTLDCTSTTTIGAIAIRAIGTNAISTLPVIPVH